MEELDISLLAVKIRGVQHDVAIRLALASSTASLQSDIVIKAGTSVFLDGQDGTLRTGKFSFIVEDGARLCLYRLNLINGVKNAILVGKEDASEQNSTVLDVAWVTVCGMFTPTAGAAILSYGQVTLSLFQCQFVSNSAFEYGGAIHSKNAVLLSIAACTFSLNQATYAGESHPGTLPLSESQNPPSLAMQF